VSTPEVTGSEGPGERSHRSGWRFWTLALAWLPVTELALALGRFGADAATMVHEPAAWTGLLLFAVCGLPLALGCRRLWRLGHRRGAWVSGAGLGLVTIPVTLLAGLFGPFAVAAGAVVFSLPVWVAGWWLARRVSRQGGRG